MNAAPKIVHAVFFDTGSGRRPVRDWLMELPPEDRKVIGADIATLEYGWPVGVPKCAPMTGVKGLYEVRSNISSGQIARVFFILVGRRMLLLHGFIKKTQKRLAKT